MTTDELDEYGGALLREMGARSAPRLAYGFPGWTCISLNSEVAHGIPSKNVVLELVWDLEKYEDRIIFVVTKPFRIDQTVY